MRIIRVLLLIGLLAFMTTGMVASSRGGCECLGCETSVYDYSPVRYLGGRTVQSIEYDLSKPADSGPRVEVPEGWRGPTGDGCVWEKHEIIVHEGQKDRDGVQIGHLRHFMRYGRGCFAIF